MTGLPEWDEATRAQITAARPDMSTWLSANAGSGKTRVLTDRVARLLLDRAEPQRILCLTYTKSAASEMQNRLFKRLGEWAMLDDEDLGNALRDLGVTQSIPVDQLRRARTLFAQAIETPGGLKIQTIHSFCASLLRRFPLEAGVSPNFTEVEDRAAELLRAEIVDEMADGVDAALVHDLARYFTDENFGKFSQAITSNRELFSNDAPGEKLNEIFDLDPNFDISALPGEVMDQAVSRWMPEAIGIFEAQTGKLMVSLVEKLKEIDFENPKPNDLRALQDALLTLDRTPRKQIPSKAAKEQLGPTLSSFEDLMERTAEAKDQQLRHRNAARTGALQRFATRFISLYEGKKQLRGWLDFDDLILRARALLTDPKVAAWVLYRIDGGIDHILVDEAQDTSPRQWDVIEKLAEEFTSGLGARDNDAARTLFVVGDKKQSIYSFQGADPREFDLKRVMFDESLTAAGLKFQSQSLDYSFRSSSAVLRAVDQTFDPQINDLMGEKTMHLAFKSALPGRVDLWPLVERPEKEEAEDWSTPLDRRSGQHQTVILAEQIAAQINHLVNTENFIPDEDRNRGLIKRRIRAGDFLILVQSRAGVFPEIIRACKAAGLPIAGADRLKVGAELAVRDIAALLSFLATPEDSLSLATALRSPLFGWSEQSLFTLAHRREEKHMWQALRLQEELHPKTLTVLRDLRGQVDFLRPYDLIERILIRHDGRRNLLARLGPEAEDGIDALLNQALAYERTAVPSLTGFLGWLETDDLEIKRQIDSASDQIRVMTVHGAKGLEAPIVILPDTVKSNTTIKDEIISLDGVPIWRPNKAETPNIVDQKLQSLKEAQVEEHMRLLYVAMTRAEKWLIVAGMGPVSDTSDCWYKLVEQAMVHLGAVPLTEKSANILRFEEHVWDDLPIIVEDSGTEEAPELDTVFGAPLLEALPRETTLSPSELGGAKALAGDDGSDEDTALSFGSLVHLLLERLPLLPSEMWNDAAQSLVRGADAEMARAALAEVIAVLRDSALSFVFETDALAEVAVTATLAGRPMYGIIDRLLISPQRILAIDFKSNRLVPSEASTCPEGLLRQMGAYAQALRAIYPNQTIETAILWTRDRSLMALPHDLVTSALARAPDLDATTAGS
ncbi:double-strand break repair helicase AddA [Sulfitobacter sp. SK012]|uniref:double-strand break repair helicase AddA n=1 Tax=Sulfitobacter sp. SK012 TaxID=1389005 RepID=UPI000E0CAA38|nr:double-strand break repair helicase AddA [Sulfitobacter sp. SK012]AXI44605.1 double-strand break repair helicase AddA [Sulfitobacter sp. SK012]